MRYPKLNWASSPEWSALMSSQYFPLPVTHLGPELRNEALKKGFLHIQKPELKFLSIFKKKSTPQNIKFHTKVR